MNAADRIISATGRITGNLNKVSQYEKNLPEADSVYSFLSPELRERGWQRLTRKEADYGSALPWRKTRELFRLRPNETTIWAGPNGAKKSLLVNYILADLAFRGERVLLASFELTADDQIARIARQLLCTDSPTREAYDALIDRLSDNLMVYDFVGQIRPERALALARYAAADLKCNHVLIDNLTMVVPPSQNADERAAKFVAGIYQIGRDVGCHMHLICHVRKPNDPDQVLNRYDIRGTGAAPDQVDNVVIIQQNEKKLREIELGTSNYKDPDMYIFVDKQRHASYRGRMGFWFYEKSLRVADSGIEPPSAYM